MKTEIIDQLVFEHSQHGPIKEGFQNIREDFEKKLAPNIHCQQYLKN